MHVWTTLDSQNWRTEEEGTQLRKPSPHPLLLPSLKNQATLKHDQKTFNSKNLTQEEVPQGTSQQTSWTASHKLPHTWVAFPTALLWQGPLTWEKFAYSTEKLKSTLFWTVLQEYLPFSYRIAPSSSQLLATWDKGGQGKNKDIKHSHLITPYILTLPRQEHPTPWFLS